MFLAKWQEARRKITTGNSQHPSNGVRGIRANICPESMACLLTQMELPAALLSSVRGRELQWMRWALVQCSSFRSHSGGSRSTTNVHRSLLKTAYSKVENPYSYASYCLYYCLCLLYDKLQIVWVHRLPCWCRIFQTFLSPHTYMYMSTYTCMYMTVVRCRLSHV